MGSSGKRQRSWKVGFVEWERQTGGKECTLGVSSLGHPLKRTAVRICLWVNKTTDVAQWVEHLAGVYECLGLIPSNA